MFDHNTLFRFFLFTFVYLSCINPTMSSHPNEQRKDHAYHILTAGYSGAVVPLTFQPPNTLKVQGEKLINQTGSSPSWITFSHHKHGRDGHHHHNHHHPHPRRNKQLAYVTNEDDKGTVYVLSAEDEKGEVYVLSKEGKQKVNNFKLTGNHKGYSTGGSGPVASCVQNQCLFVANYNSGSCSVIQLDGNGIPTEPKDHPTKVFQFTRKGTGPVTDRQDKSYAHDAVASPDGRWVYVPDLGADVIHHIRVEDEGKDCSKTSNHTHSTQVGKGTGPRHIEFYRDHHTKKQFAYLTSELSSTLTAFEHDPSSGDLKMIGKPVLSVPHGTSLGGNSTAVPQLTTAELAISPDGKFIYVSDRGDEPEDHITIYKRNQHDGSIEFMEWTLCGGKMPRHFSLSHDGNYAAVANQDSGNVVILKRDSQTGKLSKTGAQLSNLDQVAFAGFEPN